MPLGAEPPPAPLTTLTARILIALDIGVLRTTEAYDLLLAPVEDAVRTAFQAAGLPPEVVTLIEDRARRLVQGSAESGGRLASERSLTAAEETLAPGAEPAPTNGLPSEKNRYVRLREIGRGGQAVVYLARDLQLDRLVAIKETVGDNPRFLREARVTARLEHPGVAPIHALGHGEGGNAFAVQKFIRGETLAHHLRTAEDLDGRLRLLKNFVDVCYAVGYAHRLGIIHRDLKPENIIVGPFGESIVLDWGIARVAGGGDAPTRERLVEGDGVGTTQAGGVMGTPGYMSPEQARGDVGAIGPPSDVWSLDAILYEILAGARAVPGDSAMAALVATVRGEIADVGTVAPNAPPELLAVTRRAMARSPGDRFTDAAALAVEVESWRAGRRVTAYRYSGWELLGRLVRRNRVASVLAVTLLAGGVVAGLAIRRERDQALDALAEAEAERNRARSGEAALHLARARVALRRGLLTGVAEDFQAAAERAPSREARFGARLLQTRPVHVVRGGKAPARPYWISPDGRVCVGNPDIVGYRLPVVAWHCGTDGPPKEVHPPVALTSPIKFSPSGDRFALQSTGEILVFSAHDFQRVDRVSVGGGIASFDLLDERGSLLVAESVAGSTSLSEWRPNTGMQARGGLGFAVRGLARGPDSTSALVATADDTLLVDVTTGAVTATLPGETFLKAHWLSDHRTVLLDGFARSLTRWDTSSGRADKLGTHSRGIQGSCVAPDESWLATSSADGTIEFTGLPRGRLFGRIDFGEPLSVLDCASGVELRTHAARSRDILTVRIDEVGRHRPADAGGVERFAWVWAAAFSPDGSRLAFGGLDSPLTVLDLATGKVLHRDRPGADGSVPPVGALAWSPDGTLLAVAFRGGIELRAVSSDTLTPAGVLERPLLPGGSDAKTLSLAFTPDGRRLIACVRSSGLLVYERTGSTWGPVPRRRAGDPFRALPSQAGNAVYVADAATGVFRLDLDTMEAGPVLLARPARALALDHAETRLVVTSGPDVYVVPLQASAPPRELPAHESLVGGVAILNREKLIVTASADRAVRFFDLDTGDLVFTDDNAALGELVSLAVSPDETLIVVGDSEGGLHRLPVPPESVEEVR